MNEILIKIERMTDNDMFMNSYKMEVDQLVNVNPLDELKTIETLIKAVKIFKDTELERVMLNSLRYRIARLLAIYHTQRVPQ